MFTVMSSVHKHTDIRRSSIVRSTEYICIYHCVCLHLNIYGSSSDFDGRRTVLKEKLGKCANVNSFAQNDVQPKFQKIHQDHQAVWPHCCSPGFFRSVKLEIKLAQQISNDESLVIFLVCVGRRWVSVGCSACSGLTGI